MAELDKLQSEYWAAKDAYDAAERAFAAARAALTDAERARTKEWRRLVSAAEVLPDEARTKVAAAQFCGAPRS